MGTSLCDVTMTLNWQEKIGNIFFFLKRIHFSKRKYMFDTFTHKFPRDYTAACTRSAPLLLQIIEDSFSQSHMSFYHEGLESKMRNSIFVKLNRYLRSLFKVFCSVYEDTTRIILLLTVFFIIQPDKRNKHGIH